MGKYPKASVLPSTLHLITAAIIEIDCFGSTIYDVMPAWMLEEVGARHQSMVLTWPRTVMQVRKVHGFLLNDMPVVVTDASALLFLLKYCHLPLQRTEAC